MVDTVGQPGLLRLMDLRSTKVNLEVVDQLLSIPSTLPDKLKVNSHSDELDPGQLIMFKLVVQSTAETDPIQPISSTEAMVIKRRSHKVIMLLLTLPTTTSLSDS
jgi:hypothetical protein